MRIPSILLCSVLLVTPSSGFAETYSPKVGQRHIDFTLPSIRDGKPVSLSDFRGKKVLLVQFASW